MNDKSTTEELENRIKQLEKENVQLKAVFNAVPNPLFIKDENHKYTMCNDAFAAYIGVPHEKIINSTVYDLAPTELAEIYNKADKELVGSGTVQIYESKVQFADSTLHDVIFHKALLSSEETEFAGIIGIISDVTNLKQVEKKLQEANATKDKFFTIIAHDLRNPFNSLLGFSDLLLKNIRKLDLDNIEYQLQIINKTANQAYNLLEDLLLWSNSQSGKLTFNVQKIDCIEVCAEVMEAYANQASIKSITINCLEQERISIMADYNMFKTVLRNLISNAVKFTKPGGEININVEKVNEKALITVSDTGIGIEPCDFPKLWDFTKPISTSGTADEKGTGFGLILCKEFVERHGEKIWAESVVGKGSDFKFTMPLYTD